MSNVFETPNSVVIYPPLNKYLTVIVGRVDGVDKGYKLKFEEGKQVAAIEPLNGMSEIIGCPACTCRCVTELRWGGEKECKNG